MYAGSSSLIRFMDQCHVHICIHIYSRVYMHTYIYIHVHICIHTYIHTYTDIYMYAGSSSLTRFVDHSHVHICMHIYSCAYMHTCIYIHVHICTHTYIHTHIYTCMQVQAALEDLWITVTCIYLPAHFKSEDAYTQGLNTCIHTYMHACIIHTYMHLFAGAFQVRRCLYTRF